MQRSIVWAVAFAVLLSSGCAIPVRETSRDATWGAIDALTHPPPEDPLAVKIHALAERWVTEAQEAGKPPDLAEIASRVTEGVLQEVSSSAPEVRSLVGPVVHEAVAAGISALTDRGASLGSSAGEAGERVGSSVIRGLASEQSAISTLARQASAAAAEAFAETASDSFARRLDNHGGDDEMNAVSAAISTIVREASAAAVTGALTELDRQLVDCVGPPEKCPPNVVRRISRSAAIGAAEGFGREAALWPLALAFVIGAACAALAVWLAVAWPPRRASGRARHSRPT